MSQRSELRLRTRPHFHPDRQNETIIEVVRDGRVVATIYGSREGVQIVSERFDFKDNVNQPVGMDVNNTPTLVVPLLMQGEPCPWCNNSGRSAVGVCPICRSAQRKAENN